LLKVESELLLSNEQTKSYNSGFSTINHS
jgi:hypothetical protein